MVFRLAGREGLRVNSAMEHTEIHELFPPAPNAGAGSKISVLSSDVAMAPRPGQVCGEEVILFNSLHTC